MKKSPVTSLAVVGGLVIATIVGCGSSDDSTFGEGASSGSSGASSSGNFSSSGTSGGSSGSSGDVQNVNPTDACATSNAGATLPPVSLVFMIDRSGSMGNGSDGQNLSVRWQPVVSGLETFFGDPASANLSASLAFFPINDNDGNPVCTAGSYQTPVVTMTALPNQTPFKTAMDGTGPGGYTPTKPAMQGAADYAATFKAQGKNVAIVLATDGVPNKCSSSVDNVGTIAQTAAASGVKTYVIGVGPETGNLDSIAASGGTNKAIMIATNNTAQVSSDLIKALGGIASSLLGCNYTLPQPPAGQTLDITKVNVNYTPANGAVQTLAYSADCSNKGGWHYDNNAAPTQVLLCDDACNTAKSSAGAKLDVIFGCKTAAPPGQEPK